MTTNEDRLARELASLRLEHAESPAPAPTVGRRRRALPGWLVLVVLCTGLGIGGFFVFRAGAGRMFPEEVELGAVTLMTPSSQDVTLVATGYVHARRQATVAPKTTGRLAKLYVDEGSAVEEGQLVAELESADALASFAQVRADIIAARAKVERARADVAEARVRFRREEALLARGAGTRAAYDDAKARVDIAESQVRATAGDLAAVAARRAAAQVQLDNTKVRAPFAGTVLRKNAEIGDVTAPGGYGSAGNGLVLVASMNDLEVETDVAEAQFAKVKMGTPAEIVLDAFAARRFRGRVTDVRRIVDRAKASVTVKVRFTDDVTGVFPEMAAKVSFLQKALDQGQLEAAPKLVVPADAVVTRGAQPVVFTVVDEHARAVPVAVKAPFGGGLIELRSGPTSGTRVIRHPVDKIRDGVAVKEKKR